MNTWHPTEDDLIHHFYDQRAPGAGGPASEASTRLDRHLRECVLCGAAWADLCETLELVDSAAMPEPPGAFERIMWARVEQALVAVPRRPAVRGWRPLVAVGVLAAGIVTVAALGYSWWTRQPATPVIVATTATRPDHTRERVLLTALDGHFEQAELLLVELMNAPDNAGSDLDFERAKADDLVASGRLYRLTAEQTGHLKLAQMLDDLEPLLVEVARSPERVNKKEFKSLRTRIDDEGLLFKVRAVGHEIRERQQDLNAVTMNEGDL